MPNKILTLLLLLLQTTVLINAQEIEHIPKYYFPESKTGIEEVHHSYYSLGYSEKYDQAAYVIYLLTRKDLQASTTRSDHFVEDNSIASGSADISDYYQSGYDRGHLAPAADMSFNHTAMDESFLLSNISPQHPSFNRGIWKKLEVQIRDWAYNSDSLYVVTGPILEEGLATIGKNKVAVPNYFYKIALKKNKNGDYTAIGFLLKNQATDHVLKEYIVTVDDVEKASGLNFFANIDDTIQEKFESEVLIKDWNFEVEHYQKGEVQKETQSAEKQCQGMTKNNKQCSRKASKNSNFCWQHE